MMLRLVGVIMLLAALGWSAERLPEEGLKQAQEAERLLKQDKVQEAVGVLRKLDEQYPGHAAVSLRLAEIMDQNNRHGAALFYYRRYARIKGDDANLEVQARVTSIEMVAGAKEGAEDFAKQLGEPTQAVNVPTPEVKQSIERPANDGSLVPVSGPEDLTPAEVTPLPRRIKDLRETPQRAVITPVGGLQPYVATPEVEATPAEMSGSRRSGASATPAPQWR